MLSLLKRFLIIFLLISAGLFGADNPSNNLIIEANYVNYLEKNNFVHATGNVVVVYKETQISANETSINMRTETMYASQGFVFSRNRQKLSGNEFYYDFKKQEGRATSVNMNLMDKLIRGNTVAIKSDRIEINNAEQSACPDALSRCNLITSKKLTIYPEWGDIVHDHAIVYFFFMPIMYVPNYVADANGDNAIMYSAIPKFGSNPIEGNYAKAGISYYANEKLTGTVDVHYLSKLGLRAGFTNNYKYDQSNRGQFRMHYLTGLGGRLSYGWQHRLLLGVPQKDRQQVIDDFFSVMMPPSKTSYPEFVVDITSREMSGYQWVSYKPKLSIFSPAYEVFNSGVFYKLSGFAADIYEENIEYIPAVDFEAGNRRYVQTNWDYDIYRDFDLGVYGSITPGIYYKKSGYHSNNELVGHWKQFYYYTNYAKSWERLALSIGYKNTAEESGYSLFNSETFYAATQEESTYGLSYQVFDVLRIGYEETYSISERKIRDKVYAADVKLCCWSLRLGWSEYLQQFTFGLGL